MLNSPFSPFTLLFACFNPEWNSRFVWNFYVNNSIQYLRCSDLNFYHMISNEKEEASKSYLGHFLPSQRNQSYPMPLYQLSGMLIRKSFVNGYSMHFFTHKSLLQWNKSKWNIVFSKFPLQLLQNGIWGAKMFLHMAGAKYMKTLKLFLKEPESGKLFSFL